MRYLQTPFVLLALAAFVCLTFLPGAAEARNLKSRVQSPDEGDPDECPESGPPNGPQVSIIQGSIVKFDGSDRVRLVTLTHGKRTKDCRVRVATSAKGVEAWIIPLAGSREPD